MPLYTLNRNFTLRTTSGVISFIKDEETHVPPFMEREAQAIGALPVEDTDVSLVPQDPKLPSTPQGEDRNKEVFAAFDLLIERNDSNDFTGQGAPSVKAVEKIVGFDVDRSEVLELWAEHKTLKAGQ